MTTAYWCVLAAALLPYLWTILSKAGGGYDNSQPRLHEKHGWHLRASWAQANAWEAFAPFAAAVIIAHLAEANQLAIDRLALGFIVLRVGHGIAYLCNLATLRSALWFAGLACVIGLFVVASR